MESAADLDKTFLSYIFEPCRQKSLSREKKSLYINTLGYICKRSFGNKFYCSENFKAEFLSVRHGSTMYDKYVLSKVCRALHLIQAEKIVESCRAYRG